jgi:hypothetical protein
MVARGPVAVPVSRRAGRMLAGSPAGSDSAYLTVNRSSPVVRSILTFRVPEVDWPPPPMPLARHVAWVATDALQVTFTL